MNFISFHIIMNSVQKYTKNLLYYFKYLLCMSTNEMCSMNNSVQ